MAMQFKKAQRKLSKLRLAIQGPSGSGKTYGALQLAKGLGGSIAVIDTERGSASLYSDLPGMPEFDVLDLEAPFTPEKYVEAITAAEDAGYSVLIIDSMTHEWSGVGGCLELNDMLARSKYRGNTWSAWNEVTPRHRKFVDKMLASKCHIIATIRTKTDFVQEEQNGKKVVKKVGMKAEQRDGMDYEFTVVFDVTADEHIATTSKDRTALFSDPTRLSEATGKKIADWLNTAKPDLTPKQPQPEVPVEPNVPEPKDDHGALLEEGWDESFIPKLTQMQAVKADEYLEAMNGCDDAQSLESLIKAVSALQLPKETTEYQELVKAYKVAQKRIFG